jgi:hypothetical protein
LAPNLQPARAARAEYGAPVLAGTLAVLVLVLVSIRRRVWFYAGVQNPLTAKLPLSAAVAVQQAMLNRHGDLCSVTPAALSRAAQFVFRLLMLPLVFLQP